MTHEWHICPCCNLPSLEEAGSDTYEICPVCQWENDPTQCDFTSMGGGANRLALEVAQQNYERIGVSDPRFAKPVPDVLTSSILNRRCAAASDSNGTLRLVFEGHSRDDHASPGMGGETVATLSVRSRCWLFTDGFNLVLDSRSGLGVDAASTLQPLVGQIMSRIILRSESAEFALGDRHRIVVLSDYGESEMPLATLQVEEEQLWTFAPEL